LFKGKSISKLKSRSKTNYLDFCHGTVEVTAQQVDNLGLRKHLLFTGEPLMEALHIIEKDPTIIETTVTSLSKFEAAYAQLSTYLNEIKSTRNEVEFKDHETVVTRLVYALGQAAVSEVLSHYDVSCDVISVEKQIYRRKHKAPKEYQSALGPVTIERHVYVNRKKDGDGQCICPLELQTGIIESYWTPIAAKNATWALAHLTPQEVEDMLLQFGKMNPSRSSLDRLPKALNRCWEPQTVAYHEKLMTSESIPLNAVSFAASLDGVMIGMRPEKSGNEAKKPMKTEWREASCGTISFFDTEGERISTVQYGRMPEHKKTTLKTLLRINTESILQKRPDLKLIHLADGAQDNWTFFDEELPFGFQLTDFYHACQYLKNAFEAAYLKDPNKAKAKFEEYKKILRDEPGGIKKTLRVLRYLRSQHKESPVIETSVTYFTNNQHRMLYAEAKNNNYPIGSGVVEAACKTLVGQRLKRAGMSWHKNGGQGILTFRSLIKSSRFDKAWKFIEKQYKQKVVEHTNVIYLAAQNAC
jgi:hypothetical protein